jgi:hypothetical protein
MIVIARETQIDPIRALRPTVKILEDHQDADFAPLLRRDGR